MKTFTIEAVAEAIAYVEVEAESAAEARRKFDELDSIEWDELGGWSVSAIDEVQEAVAPLPLAQGPEERVPF